MAKAPFPDLMPFLTVSDVGASVEFYTKVFGLKLFSEPMKDPNGVAFHAELSHGTGMLMLGLPGPGAVGMVPPKASLRECPMTLYLYVEDVDSHYLHAREGNAETLGPPADMFWGDRVYSTKCPEGYLWLFATHTGKYFAPPQ